MTNRTSDQPVATAEQAHCIFDIALHSANPTVQSALDTLLTTAKLAHTEEIADLTHTYTIGECFAKHGLISREAAHDVLDQALSQPNYDTIMAWVNFLDVFYATRRRRYNDGFTDCFLPR